MESVIFDPEQYLVGKVDLKDLNLPDGVYELARHKDSGLRLWAKIVNGAALCARFKCACANSSGPAHCVICTGNDTISTA